MRSSDRLIGLSAVAALAATLVASFPLSASAQEQFWQNKPEDRPERPARKRSQAQPRKAAPKEAPKEAEQQATKPAAAEAAVTEPKAAANDPAAPVPAPPAKAEAPAVATPPSVAAEQETAFWNTIKDSTNPEEFKAYLKKFPKGTFAELAQIKLRHLQAPAGGPGTPSTASAPASGSATLKEIQKRLYALNYDITRFDGVPDARTERSIRLWQQKVGFPATGALTKLQLDRLRLAPQVKIWGALAVSDLNGVAVAIHGQGTRADAEGKALAACMKKAGRACNSLAVPQTRCAAVAYFRQRLTTGGYTVVQGVGFDATVPGATAKALSNCNGRSQVALGRCGVLVSLCAHGQASIFAPAYSDTPMPAVPGASPTPLPMPQPAPPAAPRRRPGEQDT